MRIRIDRPESMKKPYAEVIVDIEHEKLDRPFTYRVPEAYDVSCVPGSCVRIPFGSGARELLGFVVGRKAEAGLPEERIKEIRAVVTGEETAESRMILLAAWMSRRYGSTMIRALKTVLPVRKKYGALTERTVSLREGLDAEALAEEYADKHHVAKERVVRALMDGGTDLSELEKKARVPYQVIKGLEGEGVLQISTSELYRRVTEEAQVSEPDVLTEEQGGVLARIREEWSPSGRRRPVLLDGVTGSGKTVVYVELVADALREGRQAIVLIPEIALTRQTVLRFVRRFGNRVSFLHSRLSGGERYDQMKAAKSGEISVMVGPRSALFTPFPKLGLIIIDEEHEDTYHSELMPRYRSDEVAVKRGELEDARILLGSATPSLASAYRAEQGIYFGVRLNSRFGGSVLPVTRIVDMRSELARGNRSILSDELYRAIADRLKAGEQVILFLNRRGYTGQITCRSCGTVIKCPHCDVSLTLHRNRRMVCHYCGYEAQEVHSCPSCGSSAIGGMTIGTEQVEEIVRAGFPEVRVLRMDADTTRGKDGHSNILKVFSDGEADVLIGTQMIVKGHDFPAGDSGRDTPCRSLAERSRLPLLREDVSADYPGCRQGRQGGTAGRGRNPDLPAGAFCDPCGGCAGLRDILQGGARLPLRAPVSPLRGNAGSAWRSAGRGSPEEGHDVSAPLHRPHRSVRGTHGDRPGSSVNRQNTRQLPGSDLHAQR